MRDRHLMLGLVALCCWRFTAFAVPPVAKEAVPIVGCPSDGQLGPLPVSRRTRDVPKLAPSMARQLALYVGPNLAVLAPRGWLCFEAYGSDGSILTVTPGPHRRNLADRNRVETDVVQLRNSIGVTSGRWDVANISATFFPIVRRWVQSVRELDDDSLDPVKAARADRITFRSPMRVEFTTPAHIAGLGTRTWLKPGVHPIAGAYVLLLGDEPDLLELSVRLDPAKAAVTSAIRDNLSVRYFPDSEATR